MKPLDAEQKISEALDSIRPYLNADGGDIALVEVTDDLRVLVEFQGACTECSMSAMTLKAGVEGAIRAAVPGVKSIEAVRQN
jgi:Fe-S cluster biogenesis protein NfuA